MHNKLSYIIYSFLLIILLVYSYVLIDPNMTLVNSPLWTAFRDPLVQIGYHQRQLSSMYYILLLGGLFGCHLFLVQRYKQFSMVTITLLTGGIVLLSYPFLSHDFFNYLFDAKIVTFYGQNPYLHAPAEFVGDDWLRFMHWVHRPYPYGPVFLLVTLIPSFLAMGKLILNVIFFKALYVLCYGVAIYYLNKMDKKWALLFATHPLVIIEGLINAHNDLISVSILIAGLYYTLYQKREIVGRGIMLLSVGIKYLSFPFLFVSRKRTLSFSFVFLLNIALLLYMLMSRELYPWYFLGLFGLLPLFPKLIERSYIFSFGLLLTYYPFIRHGEWDKEAKYGIIGVFLLMNLLFIMLLPHLKSAFLRKKKSDS